MWEEVGRGKQILEEWKTTECNCTEVGIHRCAHLAAEAKWKAWWRSFGEGVLNDYLDIEKKLRETALAALAIDTENYELLSENKKLRGECGKENCTTPVAYNDPGPLIFCREHNDKSNTS